MQWLNRLYNRTDTRLQLGEPLKEMARCIRSRTRQRVGGTPAVDASRSAAMMTAKPIQ